MTMKYLGLAAALLCLSGCYPGVKYPDRVSEYERMMAQCPQGMDRACQEQYEHTFTGGGGHH